MTLGLIAVCAALAGGGWRVSDCGGEVWRLQSTDAAGAVADRGAVQALKEFLGESQSPSAACPSRGRAERTPSGGWRFLAADGRPLAEIGPVSRAADGRLVLSVPLAADEAVYGGGCRFDRLDKRGTSVHLRAEDGWNRPDTMYQPTPFFVTSRGAGVYLNTFASMTADVGASVKGMWRTTVDGDRRLDVYVFAHGRIEKNVTAFQKFIGVESAPVLKSGPIVCRHFGRKDYNTFEKVRRIYDEHVRAGMKPSALIVEPWPITKAHTNEQVRAELDAMGSFFRGEGVPLAIWTPCGSVIYPTMPGFREDFLVHCDVFTNGVLKAANTTKVPTLFENGTANPDIATWYSHPPMLDVTNPEAREWFEKSVIRFLVDRNILGAKIDFCEFMADEWRVYGKDRLTVRYRWKSPSVFGDQSIHHAYPCFFNVNFYRSLKRVAKGRDDVFVFCRGGGGIGDMKTPYYWAGDQVRSFPKLREQLRAVLNSRLSGVPYMSYDMAGYLPARPPLDLATEGRVFARAAEFTKFMPLMQTHGSVANFFEFEPEVRRIYADAVSFNAGHKGLVRPLVERWTDDPRARAIDDEFLFGDDLLVAPVLDDATTRTVYLPKGVWTNELTGERIAVGQEGRTVEVAATLAETPTFRLSEEK